MVRIGDDSGHVQQLGVRSAQDAVADFRVLRDDPEFFLRELAGLQQHVVGVPILPMSCIGLAVRMMSQRSGDRPAFRASNSQ